jgi:hypothetical protein
MRFHQTFVALSVAAVAAVALSACYVVPTVGTDGSTVYGYYPVPPAGHPSPPAGTPMPAASPSTMPAILNARLYPSNEIATQTGVVVGTVTNMMTGKGRFQVNYLGEVLTGEATRVSNDEKRGVASAYSPKGTYMSCDYQMTTPLQGTGTCTFSNGATYQLHLGGS